SLREAVVKALGELGGLEAHDVVASLLGDAEPGVRLAAISALGSLSRHRRRSDEPSCVPSLTGPLSDPDPKVRAAAAKALGRCADSTAPRELILRLKDRNPAVRVEVAEALERLHDDRAAKALAEAAGDPVAEVRKASLVALRELEVPEAADAARR